MPFSGGPDLSVPTPEGATTSYPFDVTLAVANTAEDFVTIAGSEKGRTIALINLGPGVVFIRPGATATAVSPPSIAVKKGEQYAEAGLEVVSNWSFIGETGKTPHIRGVVWAGV